MSEKLGSVRNHGFDDKGYERRERFDVIVECPACGEEVALWSDTEEWTKGKDGRWHHHMYAGAGHGECCGRCFVHVFGEVMELKL